MKPRIKTKKDRQGRGKFNVYYTDNGKPKSRAIMAYSREEAKKIFSNNFPNRIILDIGEEFGILGLF